MMTIHEIPWIDQKTFQASASSFVSSRRNSSLSPCEILRWDSLLTVDSRLRVGSWNSQFLPDNFAEPSAIGDTNCSSLLVIRTSFAFSFLGYVSDASNFSTSISAVSFFFFPNSPAIKAYPRKILRNNCCANWWIRALSLSLSRSFGRYPINASNGITGPLNDSPNLRSFWDFPPARKSWTFWR